MYNFFSKFLVDYRLRDNVINPEFKQQTSHVDAQFFRLVFFVRLSNRMKRFFA